MPWRQASGEVERNELFMEKLLTKEVISTFFVILVTFCIYFVIKKIFATFGLKRAKESGNRKAMTFLTLTTNIFKYLLFIVAILMILDIWGVDTKALVTSLGVVAAVAGLAMQDFLKDIISGTSILTEDQFKVGDNVKIGDFRGNVISLGMQTTKIRAATGEVKIISNRNITEVINYSTFSSICLIDIGLSYDDSVDKVEAVLKETCENVSKKITYLKKPIKILGIEKLDSSTVIYRIEAEVAPVKDFEFNRIFLKEIKKQAENNNINISYNRLDIHNV